ncbi:MAG: hypothetical protein O7C61_07845 [SAR324 cluster bacterium]|nr:hypothetical protein [SAR324 cluster bacterium]
MAKDFLLAMLFFLAAPLAVAIPKCIGDEELMAEVAAGILFKQGFYAVHCDALLREGADFTGESLSSMHRRFMDKFDAHITRYTTTREKLFQRLYGNRWESVMAKDRKIRTRELLLNTRLDADSCGIFRTGMLNRLESDWEDFQTRLGRAFSAIRPRLTGCG